MLPDTHTHTLFENIEMREANIIPLTSNEYSTAGYYGIFFFQAFTFCIHSEDTAFSIVSWPSSIYPFWLRIERSLIWRYLPSNPHTHLDKMIPFILEHPYHFIFVEKGLKFMNNSETPLGKIYLPDVVWKVCF